MMFKVLTTLTLSLGLSLPALATCIDAPLSEQQRFVVDAAGLVKDQLTGLQWQRCPVGYEWQQSSSSAGSCEVLAGQVQSFTWSQALVRAAQPENNGWRVPNIKELESIVDRLCYEPALRPDVFGSLELGATWSSSPINAYAGAAWTVNFSNGTVIPSDSTESLGLRLVKESD